MKFPRLRDPLCINDVESGGASPGRAIANVQRREAGVIRRVFENVRRSQALVHHVQQVPVILDVLRSISVRDRYRGKHDAQLPECGGGRFLPPADPGYYLRTALDADSQLTGEDRLDSSAGITFGDRSDVRAPDAN